MTPRAHRAMRRIRAVLYRHPKVEPLALALVRALGAPQAAREVDELVRLTGLTGFAIDGWRYRDGVIVHRDSDQPGLSI